MLLPECQSNLAAGGNSPHLGPIVAQVCQQRPSVGGYRLGQWVSVQRRSHGKGRLDEDRTRHLKALPDWTWDPHESQWEDGFANLQAYANRETLAGGCPDSRRSSSYSVNSSRV